MSLLYKHMTEADLGYIMKSTRQELGKYYQREITDTKIKKKLLKNKAYGIYDEGSRVGFVLFREKKGKLYLDLLVLEKRAQHRGFGGQIINRLVKRVRNEQLEAIDLHVHPDNKQAIDAYYKYGFIEVKNSRSHYLFRKHVK
jgi:ribosomal protein S18 acetylase RimI-like enzyme